MLDATKWSFLFRSCQGVGGRKSELRNLGSGGRSQKRGPSGGDRGACGRKEELPHSVVDMPGRLQGLQLYCCVFLAAIRLRSQRSWLT
jgi:hypothetical protein